MTRSVAQEEVQSRMHQLPGQFLTLTSELTCVALSVCNSITQTVMDRLDVRYLA